MAVLGLAAYFSASGNRVARTALEQLAAGIAAGWFFGQNASGQAVYDAATGVTRDGVSPDGVINRNSGAESTIHGLLPMQVRDANPDLAALAGASASIQVRDGLQVIEAQSAVLGSGAVVVHSVSAWTDESQWSGSYVAAGRGRHVDDPGRRPAAAGPTGGGTLARLSSTLISGRRTLGTVRYGAVGAQGNAPAPPNCCRSTSAAPAAEG